MSNNQYTKQELATQTPIKPTEALLESNNSNKLRLSNTNPIQHSMIIRGHQNNSNTKLSFLFSLQSKKKPDPKPFIDNPNASATKSSDLIRPRPVKAGKEDSDVDNTQNARPSSGPLTLETLFRNASMQQNQDQRIRSQTSVVETSKPPPTFHRYLV
ncbi:Hypothetical predicted protein [Mytilus galloprovincialis]|uniref:Uncharacterized protein n=1 Tax=Mytilus galloprovincialis TaxID=29158 RepID=A0A8B6BEX9_MYTGA|nr:Hypothetical predicted protein [Mytilus galloprovincialis]